VTCPDFSRIKTWLPAQPESTPVNDRLTGLCWREPEDSATAFLQIVPELGDASIQLKRTWIAPVLAAPGRCARVRIVEIGNLGVVTQCAFAVATEFKLDAATKALAIPTATFWAIIERSSAADCHLDGC
jgi:hypothetical protein